MKKSYTILLTLALTLQMLVGATREVPGTYATIQAAIAAAVNGDVVNVAAGTYNENVVVNKEITLQGAGATTIIAPAAGLGVVVSANNVTLQNFLVTGATNHGVYAGTVSNLTITNITASANGTGNKRSGVALQNVTGTTVLTGITATNNEGHGLEIGNGSAGVQVVGGTFSGNGVAADYTTGAGILVYADAGKSTNGTVIRGTLTANNNKIAGIYVTAASGATSLSGTRIGMLADNSNSGTVTLNNNWSTNGTDSGGAAVIVYGGASDTRIRANSTRSAGTKTAGIVVVGINSDGDVSPTGTIVKDCNIAGFDAENPAGTMLITAGATTLKGGNDVDATNGNTVDGNALTGFTVEDQLKHKLDDATLGLFQGPGAAVYVTPNSGSIQRGVNVAGTYSKDSVYVKDGTYNESVNTNKSITVVGQGNNTIVKPTGSGFAIHGTGLPSNNTVNIKNMMLNGDNTSNWLVNFGTGVLNLTDVSVTDNNVSGSYIGTVYLYNLTSFSISGGTFTGCNTAINTSNCSNGTISGVTATQNRTGFGLLSSSSITVSNCTINGSTYGIHIDPSSSINVTGTSITNSGKSAIYLQGGNSDITISSTTISNPDSTGVGITVVGDGTGQNTGVSITGVSFSGFSSTNPAITLADADSSFTGTNGVTITDADFNLTEGQTVADLLYDSEDDVALGGVTAAPASGILVQVKLYLQGPWNGSSMNTVLATGTLIPLNHPFSAAPFSYSGTELVTNTGFFTTNNVVDWVLVELRSTSSGAAVDRRAGLLKNDGTVIDVDGTTGLSFSTATANDYFIVVKHRNHLGVMSASVVSLPNGSAYDYTTGQAAAFGTNPMVDVGSGVFGLWTGDASGDGQVTGTDFNLFNPDAKSALTGYVQTDWNLDGQVTGTDFNLFNPNAKTAAASQIP